MLSIPYLGIFTIVIVNIVVIIGFFIPCDSCIMHVFISQVLHIFKKSTFFNLILSPLRNKYK